MSSQTSNWIECDVTDGAAVETTIQHIADLRGGIDILVNNAGLLSGHRPLEVIDAQEM
ncbi:SDR family NAD(P)-dependent oxidoreductase, partial [Solibacillus isronensis]|uniref:SDR family NAD(P)-dependent oxidoreductase n=1 Tax=Solibacillus isronensis TaxID=412383 RepID=UPI0012DEC6EB